MGKIEKRERRALKKLEKGRKEYRGILDERSLQSALVDLVNNFGTKRYLRRNQFHFRISNDSDIIPGLKIFETEFTSHDEEIHCWLYINERNQIGFYETHHDIFTRENSRKHTVWKIPKSLEWKRGKKIESWLLGQYRMNISKEPADFDETIRLLVQNGLNGSMIDHKIIDHYLSTTLKNY